MVYAIFGLALGIALVLTCRSFPRSTASLLPLPLWRPLTLVLADFVP